MTAQLECDERPKQKIGEEAFKELLTNRLEEVGTGGPFVWMLFFLCVTPNILNGFHVSSYALLGHLPDDQWCGVSDLKATNWTVNQQRSIAQKGLTTSGCTIWDWDYKLMSAMSFEDASNLTERQLLTQSPAEISCKLRGSHEFQDPESTFVANWDLVCDRSIQRTSAQVMLSMGKFFGSFSFGIFADKFGRKSAFTVGATFFIVGSLFCSFSPWYGLFLAGRFILGSASSGLFYPAFTMVAENICLRHRSWMSIAFSASYPIGILLLAGAAYVIPHWRYLQLTLTIPALLLILNCYLLNESPRWLIMKEKYNRAYKVLFNEKSHYELEKETPAIIADKQNIEEQNISLWVKIKEGPLKQFIELFETWKVRRMILTSYFMFCVTSLSYYVTALNAQNLAVSRYLYVAATGIVDLPSIVVAVGLLRLTGRRVTTMSLFIFSGVALLMVLSVPADSTTWIVSFAMMGRFGISATYSVLTLYTAELYPTEIRNSALGTCSTWAHVGSISSPYVVDILGLLGWYIPTTLCGCCVLVAGLLTLSLPETSVTKLSDRVEEVPSESNSDDNTSITKVSESSSNKQ